MVNVSLRRSPLGFRLSGPSGHWPFQLASASRAEHYSRSRVRYPQEKRLIPLVALPTSVCLRVHRDDRLRPRDDTHAYEFSVPCLACPTPHFGFGLVLATYTQ